LLVFQSKFPKAVEYGNAFQQSARTIFYTILSKTIIVP